MGISWLPLIFVVIGAYHVVIGVGDIARKRRFVQEAARATGTIVGYERRGRGRSTAYHPVVDFPLPTGQAARFTSSAGSYPRVGKVGQPIGALYNPHNPARPNSTTVSCSGGRRQHRRLRRRLHRHRFPVSPPHPDHRPAPGFLTKSPAVE